MSFEVFLRYNEDGQETEDYHTLVEPWARSQNYPDDSTGEGLLISVHCLGDDTGYVETYAREGVLASNTDSLINLADLPPPISRVRVDEEREHVREIQIYGQRPDLVVRYFGPGKILFRKNVMIIPLSVVHPDYAISPDYFSKNTPLKPL